MIARRAIQPDVQPPVLVLPLRPPRPRVDHTYTGTPRSNNPSPISELHGDDHSVLITKKDDTTTNTSTVNG